MDNALKKLLWKQFGASIDMLENAMLLSPDELWDTGEKFWYNAYHCLFYKRTKTNLKTFFSTYRNF